jgi:hypothetical protein
VTDRPNIIVFFTDQQRWDTAGVYGNPLSLTPHLDSIAQRGTLFEYAFTPQPVCGPARTALQTGLYPVQSAATATGYRSPGTPRRWLIASARPGTRRRISESGTWPPATRCRRKSAAVTRRGWPPTGWSGRLTLTIRGFSTATDKRSVSPATGPTRSSMRRSAISTASPAVVPRSQGRPDPPGDQQSGLARGRRADDALLRAEGRYRHVPSRSLTPLGTHAARAPTGRVTSVRPVSEDREAESVPAAVPHRLRA